MNNILGATAGQIAIRAITINHDPANLAANSALYVDYAVPGARTGQRCFFNPLADITVATVLTPGYTIGANPRVSANDVCRCMHANNTAAAINPDALNVSIVLFGDPTRP